MPSQEKNFYGIIFEGNVHGARIQTDTETVPKAPFDAADAAVSLCPAAHDAGIEGAHQPGT